MNYLKMLVHFGVFDYLGDEYQGVLALLQIPCHGCQGQHYIVSLTLILFFSAAVA